MALVLCSLILGVDERNVKAHFRKGSALTKLRNLREARKFLFKARDLEPRNKEIVGELDVVEQALEKSFRKDEEKVVKEEVGPKNINGKTSKEIDVIGKLKQDQDSSPKVKENTNKGCNCDGEELASKEKESIVKDNVMNVEPKCPPSSPTAERKFSYINKRNLSIRMSFSQVDMEKIKRGKELQIYHPHSMSILKVRIFTPNDNIKKEVPHKDALREAAAPTSMELENLEEKE